MPSDIQRSHGQVFGTEKFGHTWDRDPRVSEMSSQSRVAVGSPRCASPCSQTLESPRTSGWFRGGTSNWYLGWPVASRAGWPTAGAQETWLYLRAVKSLA